MVSAGITAPVLRDRVRPNPARCACGGLARTPGALLLLLRVAGRCPMPGDPPPSRAPRAAGRWKCAGQGRQADGLGRQAAARGPMKRPRFGVDPAPRARDGWRHCQATPPARAPRPPTPAERGASGGRDYGRACAGAGAPTGSRATAADTVGQLRRQRAGRGRSVAGCGRSWRSGRHVWYAGGRPGGAIHPQRCGWPGRRATQGSGHGCSTS